jgi:TolB protein
VFALILGVSCTDSGPVEPPIPANTGSIRVRMTTSGTDPDPDGYLVVLSGGGATFRLSTNGFITIPRLPLGSYTLSVTDVAANCTEEQRTVNATISRTGETIVVDLRVSCTALGSLQVTVTTTGDEPDVTGYRIAVAPPTEGAIRRDVVVQSTGAVTFSRLAAGQHLVWLRDVSPNCVGVEPTWKAVDIAIGATAAVSFAVSCPAATWIAFTAAVDVPSNLEIFRIRSNHTETTQLTHHPAKDEEPAWSPDGSRIAFTSNRDGQRAIHIMNEDGTGVMRLTEPTTTSYRPAWSPDGRRIAFVSERGGNTDVYTMNADGTQLARLTNHVAADRDPAWSPDGLRIAFASERDGNLEIYVMNADGSDLVRLTTNQTPDEHPAWSPDGSRLAFSRVVCYDPAQRVDSCYPAVMVGGPSGGTVTEVGIGENPAWSSDGTRLATTGFYCDFFYSYGAPPCTGAGIGILSPVVIGTSGYVDIWEPELTRGAHRDPTWRPVHGR